MRKLLLISALLTIVASGLLVTSCEDCIQGNGKIVTRFINVGDVTEIKLSGDADVLLVTDSTDKIIIVGESNILDEYVFDESGKSLKIKTKRCVSHHETVKITIPVKLVESLVLNGSGNFVSQNPLKAMDLELSLNGSGNFNLNISADDIVSKINGSGNINLKGSAKDMRATINGSGNFDSSECPSGSVNVTINGSGDCRVMATTALKVLIRGSGNVYYKGTPDISTEVKGSGSVEKMN